MIQLREVSKTVKSGDQPLTILHPLTLDIPGGQFIAIVGPSGSGKSTLLGLIAGLDAPTSGAVLIDGVDITRLDEDTLARLRGEKIGFVFQFFHLIPSLTAYENIAVPMEIAGSADVRRRTNALLQEVGLTERAHHYPSQLSGGEQQRVALAGPRSFWSRTTPNWPPSPTRGSSCGTAALLNMYAGLEGHLVNRGGRRVRREIHTLRSLRFV